mgnify:CR=1 FL=1
MSFQSFEAVEVVLDGIDKQIFLLRNRIGAFVVKRAEVVIDESLALRIRIDEASRVHTQGVADKQKTN